MNEHLKNYQYHALPWEATPLRVLGQRAVSLRCDWSRWNYPWSFNILPFWERDEL